MRSILVRSPCEKRIATWRGGRQVGTNGRRTCDRGLIKIARTGPHVTTTFGIIRDTLDAGQSRKAPSASKNNTTNDFAATVPGASRAKCDAHAQVARYLRVSFARRETTGIQIHLKVIRVDGEDNWRVRSLTRLAHAAKILELQHDNL